VIPNLPTELNRFALSTKLFEYIELGLPAVVARLETLEAHFSDDEVTFFQPGDAASLAAALRWVATYPAEAEAKAQRARDRVAREYSWAANRARYLAATAGESGRSPQTVLVAREGMLADPAHANRTAGLTGSRTSRSPLGHQRDVAGILGSDPHASNR
jgi:Glycosyl transferases group 1